MFNYSQFFFYIVFALVIIILPYIFSIFLYVYIKCYYFPIILDYICPICLYFYIKFYYSLIFLHYIFSYNYIIFVPSSDIFNFLGVFFLVLILPPFLHFTFFFSHVIFRNLIKVCISLFISLLSSCFWYFCSYPFSGTSFLLHCLVLTSLTL